MKKALFNMELGLVILYIILAVFMAFVIAFLAYPVLKNTKEVSSAFENIKYNYKTELSCIKNDSCTLKSFSYKGEQTNEYTFKLPKTLYFSTSDVPVVIIEGFRTRSHWANSTRTAYYFVTIDDYKYPVSADFEQRIKEIFGTNDYYISDKLLNENFIIEIQTSNSTIMWYFITFLGYILGVCALLYVIALAVINNDYFEKKLEKYFLGIIVILWIALSVCLMSGLFLL